MTEVLSIKKPYDLVSKHEKKIKVSCTIILASPYPLKLIYRLQILGRFILIVTRLPRMALSYYQHSKILVEKTNALIQAHLVI